ncbi:MAG: aldo/keto reductase [Acidobacteria bacterium]|nr:aldo/keto reductase [Acidobacteriota bacterium]
MRYRQLGNTGLRVSEISLGTAEIGLDYGFKGSTQYARPGVKESIRLIRTALDQGINLLDTARAYGNSEETIGQALEGLRVPPHVVSKVFLSKEAAHKGLSALRQEIVTSIEASLQALKLESIDLLLIHNTEPEHLRREEIRACLEEAQQQGKIRFFGASCYGTQTPLDVLQQPLFRALQVPFNLLDQKMNERVFPAAARQGVGVFVRSAYLRGVLTTQVDCLPERLAPLKDRALQALAQLGGEVSSLAEAALRFSLSFTVVSSVVIGVKTVAELEANLADASKGALPQDLLPQLEKLSFGDNPLVDIRSWQDLI